LRVATWRPVFTSVAVVRDVGTAGGGVAVVRLVRVLVVAGGGIADHTRLMSGTNLDLIDGLIDAVCPGTLSARLNPGPDRCYWSADDPAGRIDRITNALALCDQLVS
jgi:hypothetical protein